jgi:hypothetical protein
MIATKELPHSWRRYTVDGGSEASVVGRQLPREITTSGGISAADPLQEQRRANRPYNF